MSLCFQDSHPANPLNSHSDPFGLSLGRYGVQHFKELGRRGIRATADRYFNGSIADTMEWLRRRGYEHQMARGVSEKLERQIAEGAQIAVEEIPVVCEPDYDPSYWRDRVKASRRKAEEIDLRF